MTRHASTLLHMAAIGAMALGLWAWDAHGAALYRDAIFSLCF